jgi:arylsulfatase A-like enzyme
VTRTRVWTRLARAAWRPILAAATCGVASVFLGPVPTSVARTPSAERPNFVLIVTDDQRWDTIGRCRNGFDGSDLQAGPNACMPALQRLLIPAGTTFLRAYATTALCCPSRVSMLTGRYARHTGVIDNQGLTAFDDGSTLATWLEDAGYRTALVGRYLNGYGETPGAVPDDYVPPGWTSWHAFWGRPGYSGYSLVERDPGGRATTVRIEGDVSSPDPCGASATYSTDLLCRRALEFVGTSADPFFLLFTPFSPHLPATAASRHEGGYADVPLPRYPNHDVLPSPNPPSWLAQEPLSARSLSTIRSGFRAALAANRAVDDAIGVLHRALAAAGELDRTVWIFVSDNGSAAGEHRWDSKGCPYEECHRVPLVVACPPSVCPGAEGGRVDEEHFALNIDIAPTIVELSGITSLPGMDGRSLVPLLGGADPPWRDSFFLEDHGVLGPLQGPVAVITRGRDDHVYKLVTYTASPSELELYDLTSDPWELTNLAGDPAHAGIRSSLVGTLSRIWDLRSGITFAHAIGFASVGGIVGGVAHLAGRRRERTSWWVGSALGSTGALLGGWLLVETIAPEDELLWWIGAALAGGLLVVLLQVVPREPLVAGRRS